MKYNYIIVGQGLAGTILSYFLIKNGQKVLVIDNEHKTSSTKVAAGIINPITGRRYVKSWLFEELMPFAEATYKELSELLNITCFEPRNIVRVLSNNKEENDYYARSGERGYQDFMLENPSFGAYESVIKPVYSIGEVTRSGNTNLKPLLHSYREYLSKKNCILSEQFDYQELIINTNSVHYKNIEANRIIFCDGIKGTENPYFNYLPFNGAKGEVLFVRIPNFKPKKIFKHKVFFVPMYDDIFWFGATNAHKYVDDEPTEKNRLQLEEKLEKTLTIPYEILEHQAAIRPNTKDRRPFIGQHPKFDKVFIFNGLGTKGSSIAPYFANHFVQYLLHDKAIMDEVNISRFG